MTIVAPYESTLSTTRLLRLGVSLWGVAVLTNVAAAGMGNHDDAGWRRPDAIVDGKNHASVVVPAVQAPMENARSVPRTRRRSTRFRTSARRSGRPPQASLGTVPRRPGDRVTRVT